MVPANVTSLKTHAPRQNHLVPSLDTEKRYRFTTHALQRMFEQSLTIGQVKQVVMHGENIAHYPAEQPYPCKLYLHFIASQPIHMVAAENANEIIIITAYRPERSIWMKNFRTKSRNS